MAQMFQMNPRKRTRQHAWHKRKTVPQNMHEFNALALPCSKILLQVLVGTFIHSHIHTQTQKCICKMKLLIPSDKRVQSMTELATSVDGTSGTSRSSVNRGISGRRNSWSSLIGSIRTGPKLALMALNTAGAAHVSLRFFFFFFCKL